MASIILIFGLSIAQSQPQIDIVLNRYKEYIVESYRLVGPSQLIIDNPIQNFRNHKIGANYIPHWVKTLNAEGRWPDIDYSNRARNNWTVATKGLLRVTKLSIAWSKPKSSFYHDPKVWNAINLALNDWLRHKYQNPNWWWNEIGVPRFMRDIVILLRDTLSSWQTQQGLNVMSQLRVQTGTGTNTTWSADLGFHYGALTNNIEMMNRCIKIIQNTVHMGVPKIGIQPGYSFNFHGKRLEMYSYGEAFLKMNFRIAWEVRNTQWAFTKDKVNLLVNFLLEGYQWMARGVNTIPNTMDRSSSRSGTLHRPDIRYLAPFMIDLVPEKKKAFKAFLAYQNGKGSLVGFRYFPYSDFAAYYTKNFTFFLKTISTRTLPMETTLNGENLKGQLLNNGNTYLVENGDEYYNMMPVWDWRKVPGITAFEDADRMNRNSFVGSVSNGKSGLSAMDYGTENSNKEEKVTAHKIWACHGNKVICLIADLNINNVKGEVYTVLDQSRLQGKVVVNYPDNILTDGVHQLNDVKWIWHHEFAYIPLKPSSVRLRTGKVTGRWTSINKSQSNDLITDSVFMPLLLHDKSIENGSSGYVMVYCKSAKDAREIYHRHDWDILRNDKKCQAIRFKDGTIMASFFNVGELEINNHRTLAVDRPCLIMMTNHTLYVSDPSHQGEKIDIRVNNRNFKMNLNKDGITSKVSLK